MHTWMMTYSEELREPGNGPAPDPAAGRKGRLHGVAVTELREWNVAGRLLAGAFPREKDLCEELGIPRTPLREAIQTLAREWLVRLAPNRGAVVTALNLDEVEALYQAVGHIEAVAAKLACDKASDVEIAAITVLHHRMMIEYVQRSLSTYLALTRRPTAASCVASYNHVLVELWELLAPRANLYPARWTRPSRRMRRCRLRCSRAMERDWSADGALLPNRIGGDAAALQTAPIRVEEFQP